MGPTGIEQATSSLQAGRVLATWKGFLRNVFDCLGEEQVCKGCPFPGSTPARSIAPVT